MGLLNHELRIAQRNPRKKLPWGLIFEIQAIILRIIPQGSLFAGKKQSKLSIDIPHKCPCVLLERSPYYAHKRL